MSNLTKLIVSFFVFVIVLCSTLFLTFNYFEVKYYTEHYYAMKDITSKKFQLENKDSLLEFLSKGRMLYCNNDVCVSKKIDFNEFFIITTAIGAFFTFIWGIFSFRIIKKSEEEKFLVKSSNLEAMATQNSMTLLTENIHHELNSPLQVLQRNCKKTRMILIEVLKEKYFPDRFINDEYDLKKMFINNKINYIKIGDKKIQVDNLFDMFVLSTTSLEQIQGILMNMSNFKQLRYTNGNKSVYEIIEGAAKILNVTIDTPFEFYIDEEIGDYKLDHSNGFKNADLVNIIINHLKNSVEANATRVEMTIENIKKGYMLLNVKDNGNGIPYEFQNSIFQPNKSSKKDTLGLRGNGLFLNQNLLKMYGGDIQLKKSKPGQGTEFVLKIPVIHYKKD